MIGHFFSEGCKKSGRLFGAAEGPAYPRIKSAMLHLPYPGMVGSDMTHQFAPFGGGSRLVSLWEMLRFFADKFVEVFNILNLIEDLTASVPESILKDTDILAFWATQVKQLHGQLEELELPVSAKKALTVHAMLTEASPDSPRAWGSLVKQNCKELRERVAHELEGRAIYYISDHIELLSGSQPFGEPVDEAFPSARYDISEAGRCLALRRSTACVVHLMRVLEVGLSSLANALNVELNKGNWNTILNLVEKEIRSRTKDSHGDTWKNEDEPFFTEAATHFRLVKNAWRNHATHGKEKYTDEEAEDIYRSVRSFMRHLSERLSEDEQSS